MERPAGTRDMGGWIQSVYTFEQQSRLNIDESGQPRADYGGYRGSRTSLSAPVSKDAADHCDALDTCLRAVRSRKGAEDELVRERATSRMYQTVTYAEKRSSVIVEEQRASEDVGMHCDDLEACLQALSSRRRARDVEARERSLTSQINSAKEEKFETKLNDTPSKFSVVETAVVEVPTVLDVHNIHVVPRVQVQEVTRHVPRVEVQEKVRAVPKLEVQVVEKIVEVPQVQYVEKIVEVPEVHVVEKIVEVPKVQIKEVIKQVPRYAVQEVIRAVPKIEVQVVEKVVDVPKVEEVERIVEVPHVRTVEKIVEVPQLVQLERFVTQSETIRDSTIAVEHRSAETVHQIPKLNLQESMVGTVAEHVVAGSSSVPFIYDHHLIKMHPTTLREHATFLYTTLGHARIGSTVPIDNRDLVEWITMVQNVHLEPLRGKNVQTTPLLRNSPSSSSTAVEYVNPNMVSPSRSHTATVGFSSASATASSSLAAIPTAGAGSAPGAPTASHPGTCATTMILGGSSALCSGPARNSISQKPLTSVTTAPLPGPPRRQSVEPRGTSSLLELRPQS